MNIHISSAIGTGDTTLSAFDHALYKTGTANRNLLVLSSVIPPKTDIILHNSEIPDEVMTGEWGDRLYVVKADKRADVVGVEVWAGVGWKQDPNSKKGLFVEHTAFSKETLVETINSSLDNLMRTRGMSPNDWPTDMLIQGAKCEDENQAVCALVIATYQNSGWDNKAHLLN